MKTQAFFVLLFFYCQFSLAITSSPSSVTTIGYLEILVRSKSDQRPLADCNILVSQDGKHTDSVKTGPDGKVRIELAAGKYRLDFSVSNYRNSFLRVAMETGKVVSVTKELFPVSSAHIKFACINYLEAGNFIGAWEMLNEGIDADLDADGELEMLKGRLIIVKKLEDRLLEIGFFSTSGNDWKMTDSGFTNVTNPTQTIYPVLLTLSEDPTILDQSDEQLLNKVIDQLQKE